MKLGFSRSKPSGFPRAAGAPGGLLPESAFLGTLCRERKRTERSGRRIVLMLIDPGRPRTGGHGDGVWRATASALLSTIRDTDVAGWYRAEEIFGVIFTELGAADTPTALRVLRARVTASLQARLSPETLEPFRISLHCVPDGDPLAAAPIVGALYPDLAERDRARKVSRLAKRAGDVAGSALALAVLAPLFLAIAAAIRLTSPGPILFRQQRIGRHGRPFTFLKFRSMHASCDPQLHRDFVTRFIEGTAERAPARRNGPPVYKLTADPRVTRVGRVLRRTSLDELPQFVNVLRGEMSLVGPRPAIAYEIEAYDAWHRRRLLDVQPGITGLWQVSGRSRTSFDDMVRLDLQYAQGWSLWLDLKILLRTPRTVLFGDGAY